MSKPEQVKRPVTGYSLRAQGFALERDHDIADDRDNDFHDWWLPGSPWRDQPAYRRRDFLGRNPGPGRSPNYTWLTLLCNNTDCGAVALVRVSKIEAMVQSALPVPATRWRVEEGPLTDG